nr:odorant binding protein 2 [Sympiezomias velatus]
MAVFDDSISVILFLLISAVGITLADQRQKVIDFHADCLEEHGVETDLLHEALDGSPPEDVDFYRHIFCVARKANVMDDDGIVNLDNFKYDMRDVIEDHNMENVYSIMKKCVIQREDIMTTVREAVQCFMKEDHGL